MLSRAGDPGTARFPPSGGVRRRRSAPVGPAVFVNLWQVGWENPTAAVCLCGPGAKDTISAMQTLRYSVRINAPAHTVWTTMLDEASYREWTRAFTEGSYYEGSWDLGSEIRFLDLGEDGSLSGMIGKIVENRPDEFVCIEYSGQIVDGADDTTSEAARQLAGNREAYAFSESAGVTTVAVECDSDDETAAFLDEAWPKALERLKDLVAAS
jgi:uncharacterized protein YndB with AHSA1/START domain